MHRMRVVAHRQRRRESSVSTWITFGVILVVLALVCIHLYRYFNVTKTVVWDLDGLDRDLTCNVYGQQEAVQQLMKTIQDAVEGSERKLIFLIGGPGVGKHHVLNIVKKHVGCKYANETVAKPCTLYYNTKLAYNRRVSLNHEVIRSNTNGTRPMFAYFSSLDFIWYKTQINKLMKKVCNFEDKVCFVTGEVMSGWRARRLQSAARYEDYVSFKAKVMHVLLWYHFLAKDVVFVQFKPLAHSHVERCLQNQNVNVTLIRTNKDFVPLGCKTR